jgi:hypothetical protein
MHDQVGFHGRLGFGNGRGFLVMEEGENRPCVPLDVGCFLSQTML